MSIKSRKKQKKKLVQKTESNTAMNYKELIAANASCVGVWRFDLDEFVVEDETGISKILNWKSGGAPFEVLPSMYSKARRIDGVFGKVAEFPFGTSYRLPRVTWNANDAYTILVIFKPDNYEKQMAVAGSKVAYKAANVRVETLSGADKPLVRHVRGAILPALEVVDPSKFVVFYATYGGNEDAQTYSQIKGGASLGILDDAVAVDDLTFDIGSAYSEKQFQGQIDFVALFSKDLSADKEFKTIVEEYIDARTVMK